MIPPSYPLSCLYRSVHPSHAHAQRGAGIATGNWGCGAFYGSVELKSMLLWIVCSLLGRPLYYFPYGDKRAAQLPEVRAHTQTLMQPPIARPFFVLIFF
jgi:hypothetical protein